jgi:PAP2 superfamily
MNRIHAVVASADRRLPRGVAHLCLQFILWMGFYFAYNITRGLADRDIPGAFANSEWIARTENRLGTLFEPSLQQVLEWAPFLTTLTIWTYWFSQFIVVGVVLFWVYFRHNERFAFFRNWLFLANVVGLVCYVLVPTAPPRMLPHWGFTDTLNGSSTVNHGTVDGLANQFAAMPSLHAMDALIVGVVMFTVVRSPIAKALWLAWPVWVSFAIMATANHYWFDIAASVAIAAAVAAVLRPRKVLAALPFVGRRADLARSEI